MFVMVVPTMVPSVLSAGENGNQTFIIAAALGMNHAINEDLNTDLTIAEMARCAMLPTLFTATATDSIGTSCILGGTSTRFITAPVSQLIRKAQGGGGGGGWMVCGWHCAMRIPYKMSHCSIDIDDYCLRTVHRWVRMHIYIDSCPIEGVTQRSVCPPASRREHVASWSGRVRYAPQS
mmetsp:Transcript_16955/g.46925  ORF Transcript_16955/g.46925 Transcript_16955/m.46925 type:complete len:178 (+) Transcript_16955:1027-1560(+)